MTISFVLSSLISIRRSASLFGSKEVFQKEIDIPLCVALMKQENYVGLDRNRWPIRKAALRFLCKSTNENGKWEAKVCEIR